MLEFVGILVIAFLAAFGLVWIIYTLAICFAADRERTMYLVIPADAYCKDLEMQIFEAQMQIKRMGASSVKKIIILDNGMSEEMREIARCKAAECGEITVMTACELQNLV